MNKTIYFYDFMFHKNGESSPEILESLNEDQIDTIFLNLKEHSFVLGGNNIVISGIDDLKILKVTKRDYFKYDMNEHKYHKQAIINEEGDIEDFEVDNGESQDITNELLAKYNIRGWYYRRIGRVILEGNILYVDNFQVGKVEEGSKAQELLKLIIFTSNSNGENNIYYEQLKEVYKNGSISFKTLQAYDISERGIRDILGQKITRVRREKGIEFIEISSKYIALWHEKG